jgi:dihydrofolate reductase
MARIKLYIATSLDGHIAREDGSLDWLEKFPNPDQIDYGYADFYSTIDSVVMGRATYEQILGFDVDWPYAECNSYVVTSDREYQAKTNKTEVIHDLTSDRILELRRSSKKDIWLVGGGQLVAAFLNLGEIDEMVITIIPTIIGEGIPLFPKNANQTTFKLVNAESFESGVVQLVYAQMQ